MSDKIAMLAAAAIIIIRRRRRRRSDARQGRQCLSGVANGTAIGQGQGGIQEFVATKLAPDTGGFHSFLRMTHDQFAGFCHM